MNISIKIEVDGFLLTRASNLEKTREECFIPEGSSIQELLDIVGLSKKFISFATVNGERKPLDHLLKENDRVAIYPYLVGG